MKNRRLWSSQRFLLYSYFLVLILGGSLMLSLPAAWKPGGEREAAKLVDAFFTAVSAVCVTGLATIDMAFWSPLGKGVILILIQGGGLGIVSFSMLYLVLPRARVSLRNSQMIRESFTPVLEIKPKSMLRSIVITTFLVEGAGALVLALAFARRGEARPWIKGIFHAVSAFSNAGFSLFSDSFVSYQGDVLINATLMLLIILGGLGFVVIRDIRRKLSDWRRPLLFHTRLMILAVPLLIVLGAGAYFFLEGNNAFSDLPLGRRGLAALFQSVTTRTAGFHTVEQGDFSLPSQFLSMGLMLTGGGSGSTAGGLKVSTVGLLLLVLFQGVNQRGDSRFLNRRLAAEDIHRAAFFFMQAILLLGGSVFALSLFENPRVTGFSFLEILFESVSALGTAGLSLGISPRLSPAGKIVVAATMFGGRVGLFSLALRVWRDRTERLIEYPRGEVLIG